MPRDLPIGNGNMLIAFDSDYCLREFFYPHVGEESHTENEPFRFGVWVNGSFSWIPDGWKLSMDYLENTLITDIKLTSRRHELQITANDSVDFHENIYIKKITVRNLSAEEKDVRLFLTQNFNIYGNSIGDTAAFRPEARALLHYKGERYFLINIFANRKFGIDLFATGNKKSQYEGTWRDAEDGVLGQNPIAQGSVDSVVCIPLHLKAHEEESSFYWICAGRSWKEVSSLNAVIQKKRPESLMKRTSDYWRLWIDKEEADCSMLQPELGSLYRKSLLIIRTQINNCGSIIAANDSDVVHFNRDTYSYLWPRDGALVAQALDLAGYWEITQRFFNFCAEIIEREGYFLHKYTPSGRLASSWHPWLKGSHAQLPIQEDETALVIWALWNHFKCYKDIEFIRPLYRPLIKNAADFMMNYRDSDTGLPLPSYDLWEERQGILTFTASAVYGGLMAAANFTEAFGETGLATDYRNGAGDIRRAMDKHLYLEKEKRFARMINFRKDGAIEVDAAVDASLSGAFAFGAYDPFDEKVRTTMEQVYEKLWCRTDVGGLARYENDLYYRTNDRTPGNPWFVTTLWLAQYYVAVAKKRSDLDKAVNILQWVTSRALPSGVLAEQVNPFTSEPLSVSPLTWSHATYVATVQQYRRRLREIEKPPTPKSGRR